MRQHQLSEEESAAANGITYVSGQTRVTPEELTQAVMALETRKEAETHRHADTVPIAEVIQHLGLEMTPEELLAEVEAQRRQKTAPTQTVTETTLAAHKTNRTLAIAMSAGGLLWLGATFLFISLYLSQSAQVTRERLRAEQMARQSISVAPETKLTGTVTASGLQPLASIAEGQPSYARFSDVVGLANGTPAAKIMVAHGVASMASGTPQWEILKFRGHYFVRAWRYRPEDMSKHPPGSEDWVSAQVSDADTEYAEQIPIERFHSIQEPPSVVDPDTQLNEQVYLPEADH